eukprot:1193086-Prorocentrum_minimum.AAC.7
MLQESRPSICVHESDQHNYQVSPAGVRGERKAEWHGDTRPARHFRKYQQSASLTEPIVQNNRVDAKGSWGTPAVRPQGPAAWQEEFAAKAVAIGMDKKLEAKLRADIEKHFDEVCRLETDKAARAWSRWLVGTLLMQ